MHRHPFCLLSCLVLLCGSVLSPFVPTLAYAEPLKAVTPVPRAESWWAERHERIVSRLRRGHIDLLFIGDSITQGWEEEGRRVWDAYYGRRQAVNLGYNGDCTEQVLWRLQQGELVGIAPKLTVVMIGTNNTGSRQDPPKDTAAGIDAILATLHTRLPKTKILLLAVFPRGMSADDPLRRINMAINDRIRAYADQRQVFFLDLGPRFLDDQGRLSGEVMPDALHPSERGYRLWAEGMEEMVKRLMDE